MDNAEKYKLVITKIEKILLYTRNSVVKNTKILEIMETLYEICYVQQKIVK